MATRSAPHPPGARLRAAAPFLARAIARRARTRTTETGAELNDAMTTDETTDETSGRGALPVAHPDPLVEPRGLDEIRHGTALTGGITAIDGSPAGGHDGTQSPP